MLYLTSQRTKLSDFLCVGVLEIIKDQCKNKGAKKASGWRNNQINVPFPLESTHPGYRCMTCALVLSFCTQGDLSKSEHMLG